MKYVLISFFIFLLGLTGLLNPIRTGILTIISPIQFGLSKLGYTFIETTAFFSSSNLVRQENIELRKKVQSLESALVDFKQLKEQNQLLKTQLETGFDQGETGHLVLASVRGNPTDLYGLSILANRGTKDGVRQGNIVLVGKYLVGVVKSAEYAVSTVELIISPNSSFTAYDLDTPGKTYGLIKGKNAEFLSFDRILPNEPVSVGDTIVTSGREGIFIPDLIVGRVESVNYSSSDPLKSAMLTTLISFTKLREVFILVD